MSPAQVDLEKRSLEHQLKRATARLNASKASAERYTGGNKSKKAELAAIVTELEDEVWAINEDIKEL